MSAIIESSNVLNPSIWQMIDENEYFDNNSHWQKEQIEITWGQSIIEKIKGVFACSVWVWLYLNLSSNYNLDKNQLKVDLCMLK